MAFCTACTVTLEGVYVSESFWVFWSQTALVTPVTLAAFSMRALHISHLPPTVKVSVLVEEVDVVAVLFCACTCEKDTEHIISAVVSAKMHLMAFMFLLFLMRLNVIANREFAESGNSSLHLVFGRRQGVCTKEND